jgi:hypothetical protein
MPTAAQKAVVEAEKAEVAQKPAEAAKAASELAIPVPSAKAVENQAAEAVKEVETAAANTQPLEPEKK